LTGVVPPGYFAVLEAALKDPDFVRTYVRQLQDGGEMAIGGAMRFAENPQASIASAKKKVKRKKSAYSKALSKELKSINKAARTKSGKLRKGMTQKKILAKAHKAVKRRLK
jgi:hypothetical protein